MSHEEKQLSREKKMRSLLKNLANSPKKIKEEYKNIPQQLQMLWLRVHCDSASRSDHVKLKCLDCCCWEREEVRKCTTQQCPLWKIRPYK